MNENTSWWQHPVIFFITRLLILLGMVLFFASTSTMIGLMLCKPLLGFDAFAEGGQRLTQFSNDPETIRALKLVQAFSFFGFAIPAWLFSKALNQESKAFLRIDQPPRIPFILLAIGILVVSSPFSSWLVYINEKISFPASMRDFELQLQAAEEAAKKLSDAFTASSSMQDLFVNMIIIAVLPAIGEELLFRGALQNFLRMCFRNHHAAIWISAFIFSAVHGQFYGFLSRFVLGAALGYTYFYSRSIWVPIIMHFINNALVVMYVHYKWNESGIEFLGDGYVFEQWYINAGSALLTAASIWLMYKLSDKQAI